MFVQVARENKHSVVIKIKISINIKYKIYNNNCITYKMNSPVKRSIGDINKNYMSSLLQHNLIIPENEIPDLSYKQA